MSPGIGTEKHQQSITDLHPNLTLGMVPIFSFKECFELSPNNSVLVSINHLVSSHRFSIYSFADTSLVGNSFFLDTLPFKLISYNSLKIPLTFIVTTASPCKICSSFRDTQAWKYLRSKGGCSLVLVPFQEFLECYQYNKGL